MWTNRDLKERGKAAFKANYWRCVLCAFILSLLTGGTAVATRGAGSSGENSSQEIGEAIDKLTPGQQMMVAGIILGTVSVVMIISILLKIFLFNPLQVGAYSFFKENILSGGDGSLDELKNGFGNYGRTFLTLFLRDLFLVLWTMLFFIPGIVKAYSYRMVPYILEDDPDLSSTEVITRSRDIMRGNKWKAFIFDLSFIGWYLLGFITLGLVNLFWTKPYKHNADAALYLEIR